MSRFTDQQTLHLDCEDERERKPDQRTEIFEQQRALVARIGEWMDAPGDGNHEVTGHPHGAWTLRLARFR